MSLQKVWTLSVWFSAFIHLHFCYLAALLYICHDVYLRTHFVSSIDVKPSWPTTSALELIGFSFRLMNGMFRIKWNVKIGFFLFLFIYLFYFFFLDDWRTKRSSYVYHLGDVMNIQASFLMAEHAPFRLVMDSCVVTLEPNAASVPRYVFVQNHGSVGIWDSSAVKRRWYKQIYTHIWPVNHSFQLNVDWIVHSSLLYFFEWLHLFEFNWIARALCNITTHEVL